MPRELVHWHVLHTAQQRLDPASSVRQALAAAPQLAEIGALAHDAPYYLEGGRAQLSQLGALLHGSYPGDPLSPLLAGLRYASEALDGEQQQRANAFLLGMLSHATTDIVFHPFVFYYTGEYSDPCPLKRLEAQTKHRILEVYLDLWIAKQSARQGQTKTSPRIDRRLARCKEDYQMLAALLEHGLLPGMRQGFPEHCSFLSQSADAATAQSWIKGLEDMAFYQRLFLSPVVGMFAMLLKTISAKRFGPLEALCNFGRERSFDACLDAPLHFRNPVSNERQDATLVQLLEQAVALTVAVFHTLEPVLTMDTTDYTRLKEFLEGRSLNYGVVNAPLGSAQYYSSKGLELKGLRFLSDGAQDDE